LAPLYIADDEAEAAELAAEMVERLFASPRGRQLAGAAEIHRELEFLLAWPLATDDASRETAAASRYLRGYIDCLYQDQQGAWRIVDYKSDAVTPADINRVAKQYEMQLCVYAMAAERALGVSPVELALFFLRTGDERHFAWNEDARQRGIKLVNDALGRVSVT
jgi:ATP-dependent helicase/nuclease subunit A